MYTTYNARSNKIMIKEYKPDTWQPIAPGALLEYQIKELLKKYCKQVPFYELSGAMQWLLRDSKYSKDIEELRCACYNLISEATRAQAKGDTVHSMSIVVQLDELLDEGAMILSRICAQDVNKMKFLETKAWLMRDNYPIKVNRRCWFKLTNPIKRDITRIIHDFSRFNKIAQQDLHIISPAIKDKIYIYQVYDQANGAILTEYRIYPEGSEKDWDEADKLPIEYI